MCTCCTVLVCEHRGNDNDDDGNDVCNGDDILCLTMD